MPYFIKIDTLAQVFSFDFCKIFKSTFLTEHVWATASRMCLKIWPYGKSYVSHLLKYIGLKDFRKILEHTFVRTLSP